MKKLFCLFVTCVMCLSFTACMSDLDSETDSGKEPSSSESLIDDTDYFLDEDESDASAEKETKASKAEETEKPAATKKVTTTEATTVTTTTKAPEVDENVQMVWIPRTGSKYHSSSDCSNMRNPSHVTISDAIDRGYTPCKKCY